MGLLSAGISFSTTRIRKTKNSKNSHLAIKPPLWFEALRASTFIPPQTLFFSRRFAVNSCSFSLTLTRYMYMCGPKLMYTDMKMFMSSCNAWIRPHAFSLISTLQTCYRQTFTLVADDVLSDCRTSGPSEFFLFFFGFRLV